MKIKTKLIVSFCIILFVPILLTSLTVFGFQQLQFRAIEKTYGMEAGSYNLTNSLQLLSHMTQTEYDEIVSVTDQTPEQMKDMQFLEQLQEKLSDKYSYLVVKRDGEIYYNGGIEDSATLDGLYPYGSAIRDSTLSRYQEAEDQLLIRQVDFAMGDGEEWSAYIITTEQSIRPQIKSMIVQMVIAMVLILIVTAALLIGWLYSSIINPLGHLQVAAENIKEGNLDFQLDVSATDEIGELCVSFEEMRLRLKDNVEEKLSTEKENRMLISNIAHDLKTPITAVKGYAEGILDGVANTPEKVERYVRTIYNKANDMDKLINELTLYSKIDTNRIPYNFTRIHVVDYFNDCAEEIGLDLEARGLTLSYDNRVEPEVMIIADPEQLRRVINNIISNSVKYMNKQAGHISIRLKDVGDFIQVEMEDNGKGIAQRDLPYIFDRFYRADASRNSATGGSGIGLSIVKKIIEDHGGKIWATSKEDTGTCMYFVIRKYFESEQA